MIVALLVLAGGLGATTRYLADGALKARLGENLPTSTLIVNVSGALALGILTGLALGHHAPEDLRVVLGTGFCGGYTTFSTASVETVRLAQRGDAWPAVGYAASGYLLSALAAGLGLVIFL